MSLALTVRRTCEGIHVSFFDIKRFWKQSSTEKILHGTIASSGRCEFTVTFFGKNILCFIEFNETLPTNALAHSNVLAQVIAEMDGADTHNWDNQYDGCPIHAILTDGYSFEFYLADFKMRTIHRGIGGVEHGIYPDLEKNYDVEESSLRQRRVEVAESSDGVSLKEAHFYSSWCKYFNAKILYCHAGIGSKMLWLCIPKELIPTLVWLAYFYGERQVCCFRLLSQEEIEGRWGQRNCLAISWIGCNRARLMKLATGNGGLYLPWGLVPNNSNPNDLVAPAVIPAFS